MAEQEEKPVKLKIWVKFGHDRVWHIVKSSGFYPSAVEWTPEELRVFLNENKDVEPVLMY